MTRKEGNISHINAHKRKTAATSEEELAERIAAKVDARVAKHFQEQNEMLRNSISRLIRELDGVRRGEVDHAFAKVALPDDEAHLPTVEVDASLLYPYSAEDIARQLDLTSVEVGTLLGPNGLDWAGNPRYQEMDRWKQGRTRFWHKDVPDLLKAILENPSPKSVANASKRVKAIVRKYRRKNGLAELVALEQRNKQE